jgi:electron transport complex protein RnfC
MTAPFKGQFWPLPRGIHPPENKQQSLREPIRKAALPKRLVLPLTQPGFVQAELCVSVGQQVRKGEVLARGTPGMGITLHASTSGIVSDIAEHQVPNASGLPELCLMLESDGRDEWLKLPPLDYQHCDAPMLIQRINECGINGLGGAGFPTHAKLQGALNSKHKIHTLVINAAECEPFITADHALMREQADEIVTGICILLQILKPERCLIGMEDNKSDAIIAMQAAVTRVNDPRISLVVIPTLYPSGAEKQLIYMLTGTEIPSGTITLGSGILCQNVGTVHAIARAVAHGEALVSRIVTLTGAALKRPGNLDVLIGTPIAELLQQCDVDATQLSRLINGGPLMGLQLPHANLPVLKITNCVIATTNAEMPPPVPAQACIRCGFCADVCPATLLPQQLYWFARSKELEKAESHNLLDCIECGACAYVCPSHIPLVQYYRAAKAELREEKEKHLMAEHSKERYDYHQARKEEEKRLEEQRRAERVALAKQRKEAANAALAVAGASAVADADSAAKAAIAAAMERVKAKKAAQPTTTDSAAAPASIPAPDSDTKV